MKRFQGMLQVVRFNPPFYIGGAIALIIGCLISSILPSPFQQLAWLGLLFAAWWFIASLVVSHWVYDLSEWPRGQWLARAFQPLSPDSVLKVLNIHSGFDETTQRIRNWLPKATVQALDLFDPQLLSEKSIHRARAYLPPLSGTLSASLQQWPEATKNSDLILFLLSAHEFRNHADRILLFQRSLKALHHVPHSTLILVEHLRDLPNFIAFGPGFMHFHSASTWRQAWSEAGWQEVHQFRITPFLQLWQLKPRSLSSHD